MRSIIRLVSVCELLLAAFFGMLTVFSVAALCNGRSIGKSVFGIIICIGIVVGLALTARALYASARWAYWSSLMVGVAVCWFAGFSIWDSVRVKAHYNGEEAWGFFMGIFLLVPSGIALIAWALPQTRRAYFQR